MLWTMLVISLVAVIIRVIQGRRPLDWRSPDDCKGVRWVLEGWS